MFLQLLHEYICKGLRVEVLSKMENTYYNDLLRAACWITPKFFKHRPLSEARWSDCYPSVKNQWARELLKPCVFRALYLFHSLKIVSHRYPSNGCSVCACVSLQAVLPSVLFLRHSGILYVYFCSTLSVTELREEQRVKVKSSISASVSLWSVVIPLGLKVVTISNFNGSLDFDLTEIKSQTKVLPSSCRGLKWRTFCISTRVLCYKPSGLNRDVTVVQVHLYNCSDLS